MLQYITCNFITSRFDCLLYVYFIYHADAIVIFSNCFVCFSSRIKQLQRLIFLNNSQGVMYAEIILCMMKYYVYNICSQLCKLKQDAKVAHRLLNLILLQKEQLSFKRGVLIYRLL